MTTKKLTAVVAGVTAAAAVLGGVGVYAVTSYGTESDPLITKSYLDSVLAPELESEMQDILASYSGESYTLVTLSDGQTLTGQAGCEILLRIGSAVVVCSESPGLVDTTSGSTLDSGSLTANHLYMVTIAGNGVKASGSTVKMFVRGGYSIS